MPPATAVILKQSTRIEIKFKSKFTIIAATTTASFTFTGHCDHFSIVATVINLCTHPLLIGALDACTTVVVAPDDRLPL